MANKVVARYIDGRRIKGTTHNVDPSKPSCHVRGEDGQVTVVWLAELKALFFVKDSDGDSKYKETKTATPGDTRLVGGKPVIIQFHDNETIVGTCIRFPPLGDFFFVTPIDPKSNNLRILINRSATASIRGGPEAAANPNDLSTPAAS